jgi:hypothetical protein
MGYVLDGDDVAERQDLMTLQAETAALQNRVAAILTTSWDTAAQMKGYVDEMDGLLRRYNDSYGMKAFLWAAKGRPAFRNSLNELEASVRFNRDSYNLSYRAKMGAATATSIGYDPPLPSPVDASERIRRSFVNQCVVCGSPLPGWRVAFCPFCGRFPYL